MVGAEQRLRTLDGERLDLVNDLLAFVVAPADVALRVLVGQLAAGRLENRAGNVVLRRDQPDLAPLTVALVVDEPGDVWVGLRERHGASMRRDAQAFGVATSRSPVVIHPRHASRDSRRLPSRCGVRYS